LTVIKAVNKKRPVNLNLFAFKFPLPALTSIVHRVSGAFLFVIIPLLLSLLQQSLASEASFAELKSTLDNVVIKLILWVTLSALFYHLVAGIRHLLMDVGIGESLQGGQRGAMLVIVAAVVLSVIAGVWTW